MDNRLRYTYPNSHVSRFIYNVRYNLKGKTFKLYPRFPWTSLHDNFLSSSVLSAHISRTTWHDKHVAYHHIGDSIKLYSLSCTDQPKINQ